MIIYKNLALLFRKISKFFRPFYGDFTPIWNLKLHALHVMRVENEILHDNHKCIKSAIKRTKYTNERCNCRRNKRIERERGISYDGKSSCRHEYGGTEGDRTGTDHPADREGIAAFAEADPHDGRASGRREHHSVYRQIPQGNDRGTRRKPAARYRGTGSLFAQFGGTETRSHPDHRRAGQADGRAEDGHREGSQAAGSGGFISSLQAKAQNAGKRRQGKGTGAAGGMDHGAAEAGGSPAGSREIRGCRKRRGEHGRRHV